MFLPALLRIAFLLQSKLPLGAPSRVGCNDERDTSPLKKQLFSIMWIRSLEWKKKQRKSGFYINAAAQREDFGGWISSTISPETIYCCLSEESLRLVDRSNLWGQQILSGGYMSRSLRAVWWSRVLFFSFSFFPRLSFCQNIRRSCRVQEMCHRGSAQKLSDSGRMKAGWANTLQLKCKYDKYIFNFASWHDLKWRWVHLR